MLKSCKTCMHASVCKYIDKVEETSCNEPFEINCKYYLFKYNMTAAGQALDKSAKMTLFNQLNTSECNCNMPYDKMVCCYYKDGKCSADLQTQQTCTYGRK